ncbi:basic proline-rich protein-like [Corvus hawaiiensis]|uniref:basic proline-rich protein-like n=1 Tax=Corvus hawaiiensis TaxID=134902 RepID=UPI00201A1BAC|nr:basic proline-rich protein-like [Corvus hawaiiensis]
MSGSSEPRRGPSATAGTVRAGAAAAASAPAAGPGEQLVPLQPRSLGGGAAGGRPPGERTRGRGRRALLCAEALPSLPPRPAAFGVPVSVPSPALPSTPVQPAAFGARPGPAPAGGPSPGSGPAPDVRGRSSSPRPRCVLCRGSIEPGFGPAGRAGPAGSSASWRRGCCGPVQRLHASLWYRPEELVPLAVPAAASAFAPPLLEESASERIPTSYPPWRNRPPRAFPPPTPPPSLACTVPLATTASAAPLKGEAKRQSSISRNEPLQKEIISGDGSSRCVQGKRMSG